MALNFSHRPLFTARLSEDNLVAPMRIANGYHLVEEKVEDCFDYGRDRGERCGLQEPVNTDILDILPSDPFGMDISTTFTAITGWLEDLEVDDGGFGRGRDQIGPSDGGYPLFTRLNFIWNNAMRFQTFPGNMALGSKLNVFGGIRNYFYEEKDVGNASGHGALGSSCVMDDILGPGSEYTCNKNAGAVNEPSGEFTQCNGVDSDGDGGAPHVAISYALGYLGVRDLLVVESVCRSLRSTVQTDLLLWRSVHIDQPLNEKITDDTLLQLTDRAQGTLQCLSLVDCPRITDDALKRVLYNNPRLTKLSVPGCTRLSIDGIVTSLKAFKTMGTQGVKLLRIGGLYGVTQKHFEELQVFLGSDNMKQNVHKPHFYRRENPYLSCEDDRAIDIEMCPRCQNLKLVYDCPIEGCKGKEHPTQVCRGCMLCVPRCMFCGVCIYDGEFEETFCLDYCCSGCWKQQHQKSQEKQDKIASPKSLLVGKSRCGLRLQG